jgi:hypothetical protein
MCPVDYAGEPAARLMPRKRLGVMRLFEPSIMIEIEATALA